MPEAVAQRVTICVDRVIPACEKLRAARAAIANLREQRMKAISTERDHVLAETRVAAGKRVQNARGDIEKSAAFARTQIETASEALSAQVLKAILPAGATSQEAAQ